MVGPAFCGQGQGARASRRWRRRFFLHGAGLSAISPIGIAGRLEAGRPQCFCGGGIAIIDLFGGGLAGRARIFAILGKAGRFAAPPQVSGGFAAEIGGGMSASAQPARFVVVGVSIIDYHRIRYRVQGVGWQGCLLRGKIAGWGAAAPPRGFCCRGGGPGSWCVFAPLPRLAFAGCVREPR